MALDKYNWNKDSMGEFSEIRKTKLVQQYTFDRYGPGPYNADVKELSTSKAAREASLAAYISTREVFSTLDESGVLVPANVSGATAYHKAQVEVRTFKNAFLDPRTNRSIYDGGFTPLQSACLECTKADSNVSLRSGQDKEAAAADAALLESREQDLGLLTREEQLAGFKKGMTTHV